MCLENVYLFTHYKNIQAELHFTWAKYYCEVKTFTFPSSTPLKGFQRMPSFSKEPKLQQYLAQVNIDSLKLIRKYFHKQ